MMCWSEFSNMMYQPPVPQIPQNLTPQQIPQNIREQLEAQQRRNEEQQRQNAEQQRSQQQNVSAETLRGAGDSLNFTLKGIGRLQKDIAELEAKQARDKDRYDASDPRYAKYQSRWDSKISKLQESLQERQADYQRKLNELKAGGIDPQKAIAAAPKNYRTDLQNRGMYEYTRYTPGGERQQVMYGQPNRTGDIRVRSAYIQPSSQPIKPPTIEPASISGVNLFDPRTRDTIKQNIQGGYYADAGDVVRGKINPQFSAPYGFSSKEGPVVYKLEPQEPTASFAERKAPTTPEGIPAGYRGRIGKSQYFQRETVLAPVVRAAGSYVEEYGRIGRQLFEQQATKAPVGGYETKGGYLGTVGGNLFLAREVFGRVESAGNEFKIRPDDSLAKLGIAVALGGISGKIAGSVLGGIAAKSPVTARLIERGANYVGFGGLVYGQAKAGPEGGRDIPNIIAGGIGFSRGFQKAAPSSVEFGSLTMSRIEGSVQGRALGDVGRATVPVRVTEYGNARTFDLPVTVIRRGTSEGSAGNNYAVRVQAITEPFTFRGKTIQAQQEFYGAYAPKNRELYLLVPAQTGPQLYAAKAGQPTFFERVSTAAPGESREAYPTQSLLIDLRPQTARSFSATAQRNPPAVYIDAQQAYYTPARTTTTINYGRERFFPLLGETRGINQLGAIEYQSPSVLFGPRNIGSQTVRVQVTPEGRVIPDRLARVSYEIESAQLQSTIGPGAGVTRRGLIGRGLRILKKEGLIDPPQARTTLEIVELPLDYLGSLGRRGSLAPIAAAPIRTVRAAGAPPAIIAPDVTGLPLGSANVYARGPIIGVALGAGKAPTVDRAPKINAQPQGGVDSLSLARITGLPRTDASIRPAQPQGTQDRAASMTESALRPATDLINAQEPAIKTPQTIKTAQDVLQVTQPVRGQRVPNVPQIIVPELPDDPITTPKKRKLPIEATGFTRRFGAYLRRGGKERLIGTGTYAQTVNLGASAALGSLAATFKVRELPGATRASNERIRADLREYFRETMIRQGREISTPGSFIQRREKRLTTRAERSEIQAARRQKRGASWL